MQALQSFADSIGGRVAGAMPSTTPSGAVTLPSTTPGKMESGGGAMMGGGGGQGPSPKQVAKTAGKIANFGITMFWLWITWTGWAITLAGLSALQSYTNRSGGPDTRLVAQAAGFPALNAGKLFRFYWFILFLEMTILVILTASIVTTILSYTRITNTSLLTVATVLVIIAANAMYDLSTFESGPDRTSARCAFGGFVIQSIGNLAMLYMLGITEDVELK